MKASTPRTSRLAAVANARRRQRKERLSAGSPVAAAAPLSAKSSAVKQSKHSPLTVGSSARRNARAQTNEPPALQPAASSGSTLATNPSNTDNNENIYHSNTLQTLPTDDESISTWSQAQSTVSGVTDDSFGYHVHSSPPKAHMPTSITSKRKPKNITVITEEVLSPSSNSITYRSPRVFSPRTPKMTNSNLSQEPRSMMKLIDELTQERDRLRLDGDLYKRKLVQANEVKDVIVKKKDKEIARLMKSIGNLTVLIDEADECKEELALQVRAEGDLIQVMRERDELEERFGDCMETITNQTEIIERLKKQLSVKEELESNFDECVEELSRIQGTEEKHHATIQRQAAQIESLKKQLEAYMSKSKTDLSQKDDKITEILDAKFEMETDLKQRINELESQVKSLSNGHKEDKHNYEGMIKTLKDQLNTAIQTSEEEKASLVKGMEEMNERFTQSVDAYQKKVTDLESRLEVATQEHESTKEKLSTVEKERNEAVVKLDQLDEDFGCAKTARGKDIKMLESELEKALASKLETDKQLKDTRRQLHNALQSLDEMAFDGGKMRTDLEHIMKDFNTEKDALHRELVELRHQNEVQKSTIDHLNLDKKRSDETCDELRGKIQELEAAKIQYGGSSEKEMMQLEIKYLRNKLEQANSANSLTSPSRYYKTETSGVLERQMEQLRASEKSKTLELSQARQTIQKLKTKEKYLECRVESLANQITKTVQEYETRLGEARELGHI